MSSRSYHFLFFIPLFFFSCQSLKIPAAKAKKIHDLGICWTTLEEVEDLDKIHIDSLMNGLIEKFNKEEHKFKVHKASFGEEKTLNVTFEKGKFMKKGAIAAGYIITGVGVTICPILVLAATEGAFVLFFWVIPRDHMEATLSLSPDICDDPINRKFRVGSSALFRSQKKRIQNINSKIQDKMHEELVKLDREISRGKGYE